MGPQPHAAMTGKEPGHKEDSLLKALTQLMDEKFGFTNRLLSDLGKSVKDLNEARQDFEEWKPAVEKQVSDLHASVSSLQQHIGKIGVLDPGHLDSVDPSLTPATTHLVAPAPAAALGPNGHRITLHRRSGFGVVTTFEPPPVTCAINSQYQTPVNYRNDASASRYSSTSLNSNVGVNLPQVSFPVFDRSNPRLWKKRCESYFDMYAIPPIIG